jgi:predicted permease
VAVLAVGVGTTSAMFSIVDAVYLEDPPHIADFGDLVRVHGVSDRSGTSVDMPYPDFAYYVEQQRSFDGLMGWGHSIALTIGRSGVRSPGTGMFISYDYFDVLQTRPAAGRWFRPEEDSVAAPQLAAVISHGLWSGVFDSDPHIVGEMLSLNGTPFRVVGVAPRGFAGPSPLDVPPDVWVPFHAQPVLSPQDWAMLERPVNPGGWNWVQGIGRLRQGVTLEAARADLALLSANLRENFARWVDGGIGVNGDARFIPGRGDALQGTLRLMVVAAAAVLLIAWANVSILLLVRGSDAVRDVAVRMALGASRWRVVRVLLVESLIVGGLGSAAGVWLAYSASGILAGTIPATFSVSFGLDVTVLVFACLLGLAVSVVSGLLSALPTGRLDVIRTLKDGGRSGRGRGLRDGLVVAQVALATGLAVAAGLTARSVTAASAIPFGFDPDGRTLVTTTLSGQGYTDDQGRVFIGSALERILSLPGVRSASTLSNVPFLGGFYAEGFRRPDADASAPSGNMGINAVSPDFFDAMGIRMIAGRPIGTGDVPGAPPALVVSASTARSLWPGQDPLGRRLYGRRGELLWEVVGVAENTRVQDLDRSPELYGYTAVAQDYRATVTFVVRGEAPPAALREALYAEDPALAISSLRPMDDVIDLVLSQYRTAAVLMNALAALSLLLAVTGLYGVLSFAVTQGRRDIGIRVALGASSGRVVWGVVRWALGLALPGLTVGGTAAWMVAPALGSFLYGVDPRDAAVWTTALLALLVVTTASSLLPARRAAQLDPVDTLDG